MSEFFDVSSGCTNTVYFFEIIHLHLLHSGLDDELHLLVSVPGGGQEVQSQILRQTVSVNSTNNFFRRTVNHESDA